MRQNEKIEAEEGPKRLRMPPGERRSQILDAAQDLFFARGWDAVTIADVLAQADISKGGFYHHFAAKEDLLDGIVQRFTVEALAAAEAARRSAAGNALARLNAFVAESSRWKPEQGPQMRFFMDAMLRPGNDALFERITRASNAAVQPVLEAMIDDGISEGGFDVFDAGLVVETILGFAIGRRDVIEAAMAAARAGEIEAGVAALDVRMTAEGALIDRMLGLPLGSVAFSSPEDYRPMLRALAGA